MSDIREDDLEVVVQLRLAAAEVVAKILRKSGDPIAVEVADAIDRANPRTWDDIDKALMFGYDGTDKIH